jgi:hypothetical protein
MGYSVGHWEGDTLVVESAGFNDQTWLDHDGHPHTEGLRMTEKYRRRDFGNLDIEVTFSDRAAYSRPWTVAVRAELAADTELLEWVCNEKGGGLEHWVGKASDEKKPRSGSPAQSEWQTPAPTEQRRSGAARRSPVVEVQSLAIRYSGTWTAEGRSL